MTKQTRTQRAAALGVLAALVAGLALAETLDLRLSPESSAQLDVPAGIRRVFISNPSIVDAQPDEEGTSLLVTGMRTGRAEVRISRLVGDDLIYRVEVEPELQDLANQIRNMLSDVEGLEVNVVGDRVMLEGELLTRANARQVQTVADAFGDQVQNVTDLDAEGYDKNVKKALEKEIKLKTVVVKVEGGRVILTGYVPSQKELERVKEIAKKRAEKAIILLQVKRSPRR